MARDVQQEPAFDVAYPDGKHIRHMVPDFG
jgi:hypothetical protein